MRLLIDENVPQAVARFLRDRGHTVYLSHALFPRGTDDWMLAIQGDAHAMVIVTWDKDFRAIVPQFRRLGRLTFRCPEPRGRARVETLIESIEFEHAQSEQYGTRFMIEILDQTFRGFR